MKVLWSINVPIKEAADMLGIGGVPTVSWLDYLSEELSKECDFTICFPSNQVCKLTIIQGIKTTYYVIPRKSKNGYQYEDELTNIYQEVIKECKPDVIQQWGTEFPNAWNLVQACEKERMLDHTVIHIQGLISICSKEDHFYASLPEKVVRTRSLKEYITGNNIKGLRKKMEHRGKYEILALQKIKHVIGRTDFDRAVLDQINPTIQYHYNGEILRKPFYENEWDYDACENHRIFMSQGGIPYKGMHYALWALAEVIKQYPDAKLYVTGRKLSLDTTWKERVRYSSYELYLAKEIRHLKLDKHVVFLGSLNADQMCEQYLKANVFILPSAIDNSPNSLGEAMILGTPVVAADVGGVKNLCRRNMEGFLYQHDADYMLAGYILHVFGMTKEELDNMKIASRQHAAMTFNPIANKTELLRIYETIS